MPRPAIQADDDPDPGSAMRMEMVDRLPKEFSELVYEFGYVEELWFREKLMQLLAMTPEERKTEAEKRKAELMAEPEMTAEERIADEDRRKARLEQLRIEQQNRLRIQQHWKDIQRKELAMKAKANGFKRRI
jgi:hypothetical protein